MSGYLLVFLTHKSPMYFTSRFFFATSQIKSGKVTTGAAITRIDVLNFHVFFFRADELMSNYTQFKETTDLTGNDQIGYNWTVSLAVDHVLFFTDNVS